MMRVAGVFMLGISGLFVGATYSVTASEYGTGDPTEHTGFYCKNHKPSHYASSAGQVQVYTQAHGCSNWSNVALGTISGVVKAGKGSPVGGVQVSILTNDGIVLGTTISGANGRFAFGTVPRAGTYQIQVTAMGYSVTSRLIDASDEAIEILLPAAVPLEL
jgi:hypothetical protein